MNEPAEEETLLQARTCPVIRAAYATDDPDVIRRMEAAHPPSRCWHVKHPAGAPP